jgi:hypothetical protein
MTTYECFQGAARIETAAQELYAALAETFSDRPYLRSLFAQLSAEEAQHAQRIWLLARHQGKAPWAADALEKVSSGLVEMAAEIESMKGSLAGPGDGVDPGAVLERVVDMERRFGSIHAEALARSADPQVAMLFASLATQDARHRALIEGARSQDGRPDPAGA